MKTKRSVSPPRPLGTYEDDKNTQLEEKPQNSFKAQNNVPALDDFTANSLPPYTASPSLDYLKAGQRIKIIKKNI